MARPRSEQAHRSALDATVDVLLDAGVEGVTIEEVANRSGVAKSTLYRHFGSKESLIANAARCCVIEHPTPDTGNLADDLDFLFGRYHASDEAERFPDLLPMLIDAGTRDAAMHEVLLEVLEERSRPMRTVLQLAQLRGEISRDLDLDTAIAMIVGPLSHRRLVERKEVTPEFKRTIVTGAIAALRATAGDDAGASDAPAPTSAAGAEAP
ncbi:MAG: TetR/AcrR family transcriptional regulator [Acidimicrobiales bacterium]